jgi:hypothetical protein
MWKVNAFATVVIIAAIVIVHQAIWIPSITRSVSEDPFDSIITPGQSAELYGVSWQMRELDVPDVQSDSYTVMPLNGRMVAFLFERSRDGVLITNWNGDRYPPCIANVFDNHMRRWGSGVVPVQVGRWADRNDYGQSCVAAKGAGKYVVLAVVPSGTQLAGVEVLFKESVDKISAVRFTIG